MLDKIFTDDCYLKVTKPFAIEFKALIQMGLIETATMLLVANSVTISIREVMGKTNDEVIFGMNHKIILGI